MTFILFVDTNVILDAILNRSAAHTDSKQILLLAGNGDIQIYTAPACLLTVIYFLKKGKIENGAVVQIIEQLLKIHSLIPPDEMAMKAGLNAGFSDLEDGILYHTALQAKNITHFITSNIKDFKKANTALPVLLPAQFIHLYNK